MLYANKAARGRRMIYDPAQRSLEELPTSVRQFARFARRHRLARAILRDLTCAVLPAPASPAELEAEDTVHDFFSRHFSEHIAGRFVSALVHGVYSGRSRRLLTSRVFRYLWQLETAYGSVVLGALLEPWLKLAAYQDARELTEPVSPSPGPAPRAFVREATKERIISFRTGMHELPAALDAAARGLGVRIRVGCEVEAVEGVWAKGAVARDPGNLRSVSVVCADGSAHPADLVISTLPEHPLSHVLQVRLRAHC